VSLELRDARPGDAEAIAGIHDEAVLAGNSTFRSEPRPVAQVEAVLRKGDPFLVALDSAEVVGWAAVGPYEESNPYYAGVGEVAVYVSSAARGRGAGAALLDSIATAALAAGRFKLVAKVFTTNEASLRLFERAGYSRVGTHIRHGRLHGEWKDVVVLEKLLGDAAEV
jgi:L-amino acid N-acyltransferase YncA